jgi:DNA-binding MarR family transcriptional regulator
MILLQMDQEKMTVSELTLRGCYQGTNVSYNLKKLTESGYVEQERSSWDRRVVHVSASAKGLALLEDLVRFYARLDADLIDSGQGSTFMTECEAGLNRLERQSSVRYTLNERPVGRRASNVVVLSEHKEVA